MLVLTAAGLLATSAAGSGGRTHAVAFLESSNGIFVGDDVRILGVRVGEIDAIEAQHEHVKVSFWFDAKYPVPADANAVVLSPSLITARALQLTPAYTGGPLMANGAVIPQSRTAVPVEWDDLMVQLEKLSDTLKPTEPGGVSTLGGFISTAADNFRGQGPTMRDAVVQLAQTFSILGDHSSDIFSSVRNVSTLVTALRSSSDLMVRLNRNLAAITAVLDNNPNEVGQAVADLNSAVTDVRGFAAENREAIGVAADRLTSVSQAVTDGIYDVKQFLHVWPNLLANQYNAYHPAMGSNYGILALNNFADPVSFICGAIQAASRLGAEQSAKLCVQYLAPIVKNRVYKSLPVGYNLIVGPNARPNELDYSEDWLRPDHVPPAPPPPPAPAPAAEQPQPPDPLAAAPPPLPAEAQSTDPAAGLAGLMDQAGTP